MPIRNGRWISWAKVIEEEKAAQPPEPEPTDGKPKPQGRVRVVGSSKKAAEAAVKAATGTVVSLDDIIATPVTINPVEE